MSAPTPINVDELMARIRAEVARRKQAANSGVLSGGHAELTAEPMLPPIVPKFAPGSVYSLDDFLAIHDVDFIHAAYQGVLKRAPDHEGKAHFLTCLRNGMLSKIDIIALLRHSHEGRHADVTVQGLPDPAVSMQAVAEPSLVEIPQLHLAKSSFTAKATYVLDDFLAVQDADFIDAAYWGLLKRAPDPAGVAHFLTSLRNGILSKIEILGGLRYSREGKRVGVAVKGLYGAFKMQRTYRLPAVGPLVALISAVLRLPRIVRSLQSLENYQHLRNAEFESAISGVARVANENEQALASVLSGLVAQENELRLRLQQANRRAATAEQQFVVAASRVADLESKMRDISRQRKKQADDVAQLTAAIEAKIATVVETERSLGLRMTQIETVGQRFEAIEPRLAGLEVAHGHLDQRLIEGVSKSQHMLEQSNASLRDFLEPRIATLEAAHGDTDQRFADVAAQAQQMSAQSIASLREVLEPRVATLEAANGKMDRRLVDTISKAQQTSEQLAARLRDAFTVLEQRVLELSQSLQAEQADTKTLRTRVTDRLARVEGRVHEHGLRLRGGDMASTSCEITKSGLLVERRSTATSRFDALYVGFENRFRGSREDIRQRVSYYLPMLHDSVVSKDGAVVLDIGCGRGEWLELLRDEKINARGIDINEDMAKECREFGLDVQVDDAIAHLKSLPDNALGALTGFHFIEHISLDTLIELIEQAHRVVQPGGLVIFETPNPENVIVGACDFYMDPTHRRPLPPMLTQFLVESNGFVDVAIHRVNAQLLPKLFEDPTDGDSPALRHAIDYLRSTFLCAPDYSVIGRVA